MKKLALKLDDLEVTSFETSRTTAERGTVAAHGQTNGNTCPQTCGFSCAGTCDISCNPSCISTCEVLPCNFSDEGPSVCSIC